MQNKLYTSILYTLAITFLVSSCRKEEIPAPKPDLGAITTTSVGLNSNYSKIVYFDLGTNSNKGESNKMLWDLAFSCGGKTPYIVMNGAKVMMALKVEGQTFDEATSTADFEDNARAEHSSGRLDSMAVRDGNIFIIHQGYDFDGNEIGYFKMEIIEHNNLQFKGKFANMDGTNEQIVTITKNDAYNFVYLKWNTSSSVATPTIEPLKEEWDLVFTQFTENFYLPEGHMPYSVVGCLTNTFNTLSIEVSDKTFEEINLEYAESLTLSNDRDVIGYDWKEFNFDSNTYEVNSEKVYIVRDNEGYFYKLRFIDFYDDLGEKGTPTFEFQRL